MIRVFFLACCLFGLGVMTAQQKKRVLTEADYALWSRPALQAVSPDGKWVSYTLSYANGVDTLFAQGPGKMLGFAGGRNSRFTEDGKWIVQVGDTLKVVDLSTRTSLNFGNVAEYQYQDGRVLYVQQSGENRQLVARNTDGRELVRRNQYLAHTISGSGQLAFALRNSEMSDFYLYEAKKNATRLVGSVNGIVSKLVWNRYSTALLVVSEMEGQPKLYHLDVRDKKFTILPDNAAMIGHKINSYVTPFLSDDGKRVFFEAVEPDREKTKDEVMIYNAADKWMYPAEKDYDGFHRTPKLLVWHPAQAVVRKITDTLFPNAYLLKGQKQALVYNPKDYAPHFRRNEQRDLYLLDLQTGKRTLYLKKQDDVEQPFSISPSGKHLVVFSDGHWRLKTSDGTFSCLDCEIPLGAASPSTFTGESSPEGFAGWSPDERYVFVYDAFDIWKIEIKTKKAQRLTHGRESQIVYRFIALEKEYRSNYYQLQAQQTVNLSGGVVLKAHSLDYDYSGYFRMDGNHTITKIAWEKARIDQLKGNGKGAFAWTTETFEQPYEIWKQTNGQLTEIVAKTNFHHDAFEWGKESKVSYRNRDGESLTGTLYYPAGFEAGKTYPMIVNVYQLLSPYYHTYIPPSNQQGDGFNVTRFVNSGYFVLLPDIVYRIGDPGVSATECMEAAVDAALLVAPIDKTKIGLVGQSFGGFETSFAITQTNRFAAAVAGAAPTDLVSNYLHLDAYGTPDAWRFEHFQGRMKKTLFEDMEGYIRNSAVMQAEKVTTPLLSWTGDLDQHVPWQQSFEYHLALRRLGKQNVMLVYAGEGHSLIKPENCADLALRIEQWFGHYLKGDPMPSWGIPK